MANNSFGNIDWEAVRGDADQINSTPTRQYDQQPKINVSYWSPPEGQKKIRFLPIDGGEGKPYKTIFRHDLPYLDQQNNKKTYFQLCWDYIAKNNRGIAQPLINTQRLTPEDIKLYKAYRCPVCKARQAMIDAGVIKAVWSKLNQAEKHLFNILERDTNKPENSKCYVWTTSMTNGRSIIRHMNEYLENGIIPLDPKTGYDYSVSADGVGMGRRYNGGAFLGIPKPIIPIDPRTKRPIELDVTGYDLTEVAMYNFRDYQTTIQQLSECFGEILTDIGYVIPGDTNSWGYRKETIEVEDAPESFDPIKPRKVKKSELEMDSFEKAVPPSEIDESAVGRVMKKVKKGGKVLVKKKPRTDQFGDDIDEDTIPF